MLLAELEAENKQPEHASQQPGGRVEPVMSQQQQAPAAMDDAPVRAEPEAEEPLLSPSKPRAKKSHSKRPQYTASTLRFWHLLLFIELVPLSKLLRQCLVCLEECQISTLHSMELVLSRKWLTRQKAACLIDPYERS